jgi:cerevisin
MHKLFLVLGLLASVTPSLTAATASSADVYKYDGEVNKGSYIVKVRDGAQKTGVLGRIGSFLGGNSRVTHDWDSNFFNGFAGSSFHPRACVMFGPNQIVIGNFGDNIIDVLKSSTDVEYIAEDGIMTAFDVQYVGLWSSVRLWYSNLHVRNDAPWNLARISTRTRLTNQDPFALNYAYQYLPNPGSGVDIYVVDTGLFFPFV